MAKKTKTYSYAVGLSVVMDGMPRQLTERDREFAMESLMDMFMDKLLDWGDLSFDLIPEEEDSSPQLVNS